MKYNDIDSKRLRPLVSIGGLTLLILFMCRAILDGLQSEIEILEVISFRYLYLLWLSAKIIFRRKIDTSYTSILVTIFK
jgi:hypothetical protein